MEETRIRTLKNLLNVMEDDIFNRGMSSDLDIVRSLIRDIELTAALPKRIFWDIDHGTVYWLEGNEVTFAPMNNDNTADLESNGQVEDWSEYDGFDPEAAESYVRSRLEN